MLSSSDTALQAYIRAQASPNFQHPIKNNMDSEPLPDTKEATIHPPNAARRYKATVTQLSNPHSFLMKVKLDLAAGEHEVYGRSISSTICEAAAAGEPIQVGTRVIVTFDSRMGGRIVTLDVAKGEDALLTGAWNWM